MLSLRVRVGALLCVVLGSILISVACCGLLFGSPRPACERYGDLLQGRDRIFACIEGQR